ETGIRHVVSAEVQGREFAERGEFLEPRVLDPSEREVQRRQTPQPGQVLQPDIADLCRGQIQFADRGQNSEMLQVVVSDLRMMECNLDYGPFLIPHNMSAELLDRADCDRFRLRGP